MTFPGSSSPAHIWERRAIILLILDPVSSPHSPSTSSSLAHFLFLPPFLPSFLAKLVFHCFFLGEKKHTHILSVPPHPPSPPPLSLSLSQGRRFGCKRRKKKKVVQRLPDVYKGRPAGAIPPFLFLWLPGFFFFLLKKEGEEKLK